MSLSFSEKLNRIIFFYRKPGNAETCRVVAEQLSNQIIQRPNWTWNYVMCLWHGRIKPSKKIEKAIDSLYAQLENRQGTNQNFWLGINLRETIVHMCNYPSPNLTEYYFQYPAIEGANDEKID